MKRAMSVMLLMLVLFSFFQVEASAEIQENPCLNAAFSMIEPDNIFLRRYNEITGADVQAVFELGVPYMFGGQDGADILSEAPHYKKRKAWESTKFYKAGKVYIYGFDCSGFTKWICTQVGWEPHPGL